MIAIKGGTRNGSGFGTADGRPRASRVHKVMRILIASPYVPWPLRTGGNAAQFSTLKSLSQDHHFTLVCPAFSEAEVAHGREVAKRLPRVNVRTAYCGVEAHPARKAAAKLRAAGRLARRLWGSEGVRQPGEHSQLWNPFNPLPPQLIDALSEEVGRGVDVCQAEFADMLPLGVWFPPGVPKLFVHHQIHFIYTRRFLNTGGSSPYSEYLAAWMRTQELAYLPHFDAVVAFSEHDRRAIERCQGVRTVYTSPFPIPADVGIAGRIPPGFDGRFVFVGSEAHPPNVDALTWLLEEIWPGVVAQLPSARLVVIGAWGRRPKHGRGRAGVSFSGFVDELGAFMRGGILLVPLRIGSGIRAKILAALAQGVPVVSTSIGSEGLRVRDGHEVLVRDSAAEFSAACVELSKNPALWGRLATAGLAAVSRHYSPEVVRRRWNEIYVKLAGENGGRRTA